MKRKNKISFKVTLIISILLILFFSITNFMIFKISSNKLIEENYETMRIISGEISNSFRNAIAYQLESVKNISKDKLVQNYIEKIEREKTVGDNENSILSKSSSQFDESIFITNTKGIIVDSTNSEYLNMDLSQKDYFKKAQEGKDSISSIQSSVITGKFIVWILSPIKNDEQQIVGFAGKVLDSKYFSSRFDNFSYKKTGLIFMVDTSQRIVYHKNKYNINKQISIKPLLDLIRNHNFTNFKITYEENKSERIAQCAYIPEIDMTVVLSVEKQDILSTTNYIGNLLIVSGIVLILLMVLFTNILMNRILKPLDQLTKNTEKISNGDLSNINVTKTNDEIGILSEGYIYMVGNIRGLIQEIQRTCGELQNINDRFYVIQENNHSGMEAINLSSIKMVDESKNTYESIKWCIVAFRKLDERLNAIKEKSEKMLRHASVIRESNSSGVRHINNLLDISRGAEENFNMINESISLLLKNVESIKSIAKGVSEISNQTNILSLNASIEAARAGEYGKSFSVVAEEIGKLSKKIDDEMKGINNLIGIINSNVSNTNEKMSLLRDFFASQSHVMDLSVEGFNNMIKSTERIIHHINDVNLNINLIHDEKEEVNRKLIDVNSTNDEFTSAIEEVSSAVAIQYEMTKELEEIKLTMFDTITHLSNSTAKFKIV